MEAVRHGILPRPRRCVKSLSVNQEFAMKRLCLGLLLLAACGCGRQDVDRLARMGRATAVKFQGVAATAQQRLPPGLSEMKLGVADTLEGRVQTRLRWDKTLRDAAIEARAEGGV